MSLLVGYELIGYGPCYSWRLANAEKQVNDFYSKQKGLKKYKGCKAYEDHREVMQQKDVDAVIGGEGSGGVIFPAVQHGRDALVGTVLTLQHLMEFGGAE